MTRRLKPVLVNNASDFRCVAIVAKKLGAIAM